ncbi:MAG: SAM-dependent methyltransferase [Candidatus Micrarchaeia archaeon]
MANLKILEGVDSKLSEELNLSYYSKTINLHFKTFAMSEDYKGASALLLYFFLNEQPEMQSESRINILELGAHGIYFERGVYKYMKLLDKQNKTNYAERIIYRILDISKEAIEIAKKSYDLDRDGYFLTEFYLGNALDKNSVPPENHAIIMNELLDDLGHMVVKRDGKELHEVIFCLECVGEDAWLTPCEERPLKGIPKNDQLRIMRRLKDGYATTYSPPIPILFDNIEGASREPTLTMVHDYFIYQSNSPRLGRVYGSINCNNKEQVKINGSIQITYDVNFGELIYTMKKHGFDIIATMPTGDFVKGNFVNVPINKIKRLLEDRNSYLNIAAVKRP